MVLRTSGDACLEAFQSVGPPRSQESAALRWGTQALYQEARHQHHPWGPEKILGSLPILPNAGVSLSSAKVLGWFPLSTCSDGNCLSSPGPQRPPAMEVALCPCPLMSSEHPAPVLAPGVVGVTRQCPASGGPSDHDSGGGHWELRAQGLWRPGYQSNPSQRDIKAQEGVHGGGARVAARPGPPSPRA